MGQDLPYSWSTRPGRKELIGWGASIAGAILVHVAAAAALLVDFSGNPPVPVAPPMAAMTVELAALPSAMEQKQTEMPPGPQQVEQKVQPKPKPQERLFDPPPEVRSTPPKDALAAKPDQEEQVQLDAADRTTDTPTSVAMERDILKAPIEGSPSDQASSAEQTWENALLTHLERYKRYPGAAQARRQEDVVYLRFTMDRGGKVLNWNIERSKGYSLLDGEVNALIQRASPLPVPPRGVGGSTVEMVVPVEFFLRRRLAGAGT